MNDQFRRHVLEKLVQGIPADTMLGSIERANDDTADFLDALTKVHAQRRRTSLAREISRDHAYWMLSVRRRLKRSPSKIVSLSSITAAQFYGEFYAENRPLLFETLLSSGTEWSFSRLKAQFGSTIVEVQRGRDLSYVDPARNNGQPAHVRLADYIEDILSGGAGDSYLTSLNAEHLGDFQKAFDGLDPLPGIVRQSDDKHSKYVYMGPRGAVSHLHHDLANVIIVQLIGRKRVQLYAPHDSCFLYSEGTMASPVNVLAPDHEEFPLFRFANPLEVTLTPGTAVFVPVGWWHSVESLDPSLSVSMMSFSYRNQFPRDKF